MNCYRPVSDDPVPVLLCAHPCCADRLPRHRTAFTLFVPIPRHAPARAQLDPDQLGGVPDPDWWAGQGFVVNCDLRGAGTADGVAELLHRQEGEDTYDLIEWAAAQPWSSGKVGMLGVSYPAVTQWRAASGGHRAWQQICPWEGDSPTLTSGSATARGQPEWDSSRCGPAA